MFLFKNNRISIAGASLGFPNQLYLNSRKMSKNKLVFCDKKQQFQLIFRKVEKAYPKLKHIQNVLRIQRARIISEIKELTLNGLVGYYAIYSTGFKEYYKAWLKKETSVNCYLILTISIDRQKGDIRSVMNRKELMSVFWEIHAE